MRVPVGRGRRISLLRVWKRDRGLLSHECPRGTGPVGADDMFLLPSAWTYEAGLPTEVWIPGFWAGAVPVISGTGVDTVYSSTPQYGSKKQVLVVECYTSTFGSTDR